MADYIHSEFYKLFRRKYLYGTLIVLLAGAFLLVSGWIFTNSRGNTVDFATGGGVAAGMLSLGLYLAIIICDIVYSEQYKHNTMKNEVSYGLPRARIYLGKLLVQLVTGVAMSILVVAFYVGVCYLTLLPSGPEGTAATLQMVAYSVLAAMPQWLAILAVCNLLFFLLRNSTMGAFVAVAIVLVPSKLFYVMSMLVNPVFGPISNWMPDSIVSAAYKHVGDMDFLARSWILGLIWVAAATIIGLLAFRKKEIS